MGGKPSRRKKKSAITCLNFPVKNTESEIWQEQQTFKLMDLPERVHEIIWSYLDFSSKKILRLVSRKLKYEMEINAGHQVVLVNLSAAFARTVKVTWATILEYGVQYLSENSHETVETQIQPQNQNQNQAFFMFPEALEGAEVYCPASPLLMRTVLSPSYQYIKYISFRGICLTEESMSQVESSKSFTLSDHGSGPGPGPGSDPITDWSLLETDSADQNRFLGIIELPSLLTLLIEYDVNYDDAIQLQNLRNNMKFILTKFRCSKLQTFHVEPIVVPETNLNFSDKEYYQVFEDWENEMLKNFIHLHRSTLKNVFLFFHEYNSLGEDFDFNCECPTNLSHYTLRCLLQHPGPSPTENLYWKRILLQQQKLESLVIRAELWHDLAGAIKALDAVIKRNVETLTDICIGSVWRDTQICSTFDFRVDFSIFQSATALRYLDLYASEEFQQKLETSITFVGLNLTCLPLNLRNLKLTGISLRSDEIAALEFHPSLKQVTLINVGRTGNVGVNYAALMGLLRNKSIQHYVFSGFNLNTDPGLLESYIKKKNHGKFSFDIVICKQGTEFVNESGENKNKILNDKQVMAPKCFPWP